MANRNPLQIHLAAAVLLLAAPAAAGGGVDWPAIDPVFEGAAFVGDDALCAVCHEESIHPYDQTRHGQAFRSGAVPGGCESCHGPRSRHVDDPEGGLGFADLAPSAQSAICLQCHDGRAQAAWRTGPHHAAGVSCSSCHEVMAEQSDRALLSGADVTATCLSCHAEVRSRLLRASHHPVREGRLDCASCHAPHGSSAPALLRAHTLNETCLDCHADKRGPFVWEHAPVRESCATCHDAHGSNHRNLLVSKDSFLCLQCHSYGGHINLPRYNRTSNPYGTGCVNCHVTVHGSNHPSGAKLTR